MQDPILFLFFLGHAQTNRRLDQAEKYKARQQRPGDAQRRADRLRIDWLNWP